MASMLRRGLTWYARFSIPENRWADVGRAMQASGGVKREIVRTLQTTDRREAHNRLGPALNAIRDDIDAALAAARLSPLTDWTALWRDQALERREMVRKDRDHVVRNFEVLDAGHTVVVEETAADVFLEHGLPAEIAELERKRGAAAAGQYAKIITTEGFTVAEGAHQWIASQRGVRKNLTVASHERAFERLEGYLRDHEGFPPLEAVLLPEVTRRIAGEYIEWRRQDRAVNTVGKDHSAYSGMWKWAVRRGYADLNPWDGQLTGMKTRRPGEQEALIRAFTTEEVVKLLHAGVKELSPNRGALAATFWDAMRLSLLTGARANEIMSLRRGDIIEDAMAIAIPGGKTQNAARIIPLHDYARRVVQARLADLPDTATDAPLFPEVPEEGADSRRSKTIGTRFPTLRRRILGPDDGADWHSWRRTFLTACETAQHNGGRLNAELIALLAGQKRPTMAFDLYSDWAKLGRHRLSIGLRGKLATLQAAVDDAVNLGMALEVLEAMEATKDRRPAMLRTKPLFRRMRQAPVKLGMKRSGKVRKMPPKVPKRATSGP